MHTSPSPLSNATEYNSHETSCEQPGKTFLGEVAAELTCEAAPLAGAAVCIRETL